MTKLWTISDERKRRFLPADGLDCSRFDDWLERWKRLLRSQNTSHNVPALIYVEFGLCWRDIERMKEEKSYGIDYEGSIYWCHFFNQKEFKTFVTNNNATIICIEPFMDVFKYVVRFDNEDY